jgi:hypothetical protein
MVEPLVATLTKPEFHAFVALADYFQFLPNRLQRPAQ